MNVAPAFLRKREPAIEPLPVQRIQPEVSPEVAAFIDSSTRQREELAYLRSENEQIDRELKLAKERIRMLEAELEQVRTDRDFLYRHSTAMVTSLGNIKLVIVAAEEKARAESYAPPGSGNADTDEAIDNAVEQLAKKLAPVRDDA